MAAIGVLMLAACGDDPTVAEAPASAPTGASTTAVVETTGPAPDSAAPTTGANPDTTRPAPTPVAAGPLAAEATGSLPLTVVADGSEVALGEVAASDRPTLLWFWAPH